MFIFFIAFLIFNLNFLFIITFIVFFKKNFKVNSVILKKVLLFKKYLIFIKITQLVIFIFSKNCNSTLNWLPLYKKSSYSGYFFSNKNNSILKNF